MRVKKCIFMLAIFLALQCGRTIAEDKGISILTHTGEAWANSEGSGFVYELISTLAQYDIFRVTSLPLSRALVVFSSQDFQCYFAGDQNLILQLTGEDTKASLPITQDNLRVLTLKDATTFKEESELKGKTVAINFGHEAVLPLSLRSEMTLINTTESKNAFKMLQARRVDAMLGYQDGIEEDMLNKLDFYEPFSLYSTNDYINCKWDDRAAQTLERINSAILKAKENDRLQPVYIKYNRIMPDEYK